MLSGSRCTCTTVSQKAAGAGSRHRVARAGACAASTSAAVVPGPTWGSTANSPAPTSPPVRSFKSSDHQTIATGYPSAYVHCAAMCGGQAVSQLEQHQLAWDAALLGVQEDQGAAPVRLLFAFS